MMVHRLNGRQWHVVTASRIIAGPFPSRETAIEAVRKRTTRTWVKHRTIGIFVVTVNETPAEDWQ